MSSTSSDTSPPSDLQERLRKAELEAALIAAPGEPHLRAAYFQELIQFAARRTGLAQAVLPELGHPITLRCGTADASAFAHVFRDKAYDLRLRAHPQRILVLGAYIGCAAIQLAHRYPAADILCVEPNAANFRMLSMNTLPYQRIQVANLAAWHSATRLGVHSRYVGDWGLQLYDQAPDAERTIPARAVGDILRLAGWDRVDFILCDIEGAERAVFADPSQPWLRTLDTLAIELHDIGPDQPDPVAACFDPAIYARDRHGDVHVFERHSPFRQLLQPLPPEIRLISNEPGLRPLMLLDIAATGWGFFIFDGDSCQLHPNQTGERPPRAIFPCMLAGQTQFAVRLHHAGNPAHPIVFTVVVATDAGIEVLRESRVLPSLGGLDLMLDLPPLHGPHLLALQTDMAPGAANNFNAWAQFQSPRVY